MEETRPISFIWSAAKQFYDAAEAIYSSPGVDLASVSFPIVVNYALSCELAIKAAEAKVNHGKVSPDGLIFAASTESAIRIRGHSLLELFEKLPDPTRGELEARFASEVGEPLRSLLTKCQHYFVDGRYPYEKVAASFDLGSAHKLAKGLLDAVFSYGLEREQARGFKRVNNQ